MVGVFHGEGIAIYERGGSGMSILILVAILLVNLPVRIQGKDEKIYGDVFYEAFSMSMSWPPPEKMVHVE